MTEPEAAAPVEPDQRSHHPSPGDRPRRHDHASVADQLIRRVTEGAKTPGPIVRGGSRPEVTAEAVLLLALALEHSLLAIDQRLADVTAALDRLAGVGYDGITAGHEDAALIKAALDRLPS